MKRTMFLLVVGVLAAGTLFARAAADAPRGGFDGDTAGEVVSLTGTVVEQDGRYLLQSGGKTYSLSAPGFPRSGNDIPLAKSIEVTGILRDGTCEVCEVGADGHILVESALVDGSKIVLDGAPGRRMASGGRGTGTWNGESTGFGGGRSGRGGRGDRTSARSGGMGNGAGNRNSRSGGSLGPRWAQEG